MSDREFIKRFLSIRISTICKALDIEPNNIYNLTASKVKFALVRKVLEEELKKLYEKD